MSANTSCIIEGHVSLGLNVTTLFKSTYHKDKSAAFANSVEVSALVFLEVI